MKRALFSLLFGFSLFGCAPLDMYQMEPVEYSVLNWETAGFSDIEKFDPVMEDFKNILFFLDKELTFRITSLKYMTEDPNGQPVWASGVVFHPLNRKSRGVIDISPIAYINNSDGASDKLFAIEGVMALLGYTVILPDLLGYGVSKDIKAPFLMAENTGKVAYDMRRAAAQYLWDQFKFALPAETTIMGYSLGGSAALAIQKYYETCHTNTVKVKEVHAGGGAYDLPAGFAAFAQTGFSSYPSIPNAMITFNLYYELNIDFSQVFTGELLVNYLDWFNGNNPLDKVMEQLGTDVRAYMHADFFKPLDQQNEQLQKFHPYLIRNSVSEGWCPKAPVYIYHANADTYCPIECAEAIVKKLRKAGGNVSFLTYPGTHHTVGYLFMLRLLIQFL